MERKQRPEHFLSSILVISLSTQNCFIRYHKCTFLLCDFNIHFQKHYPCFSGKKILNYPVSKEEISSTCFLPTCGTDFLSSFVAGLGEQQLDIQLIHSFHGYINLSLILLHGVPEPFSFQTWNYFGQLTVTAPMLFSSYNSKFSAEYACLEYFPLRYYFVYTYNKMFLLSFCPLSQFSEVFWSFPLSEQHLTTEKNCITCSLGNFSSLLRLQVIDEDFK